MTKRESAEIRKWMFQHQIKYVDIMRELKLADSKQIRLTVLGRRNHRRTLRWLRNKGCPVHFLALPRDMGAAA